MPTMRRKGSSMASVHALDRATPPVITTGDLRARLAEPDLTLVDVRPIAAYTGSRLDGEARGGPIPGATPFPSAWLESVDAAEIDRLMTSKQITAGRDVVVYGRAFDDAAAFVARLEELGLAGARVYEAGFGDWAADASLPIEKLPRHDKLVHIDWLQAVLAGGRPEAPPTGTFILFH